MGLGCIFYGAENAATRTYDSRTDEDPASGGCRRDSLFSFAYYHYGPSRISIPVTSEVTQLGSGPGRGAGAELGAVRRHCLFVVHRRSAGSARCIRGPLFCHCLFREWYFVPRHVLCGGSSDRGDVRPLDAAPRLMIESGAYAFGRAIAAQIMNVFALKMAGVFMISTATMGIRTHILPRWITIPAMPLRCCFC